jgi:hypothetical protein
LRKVLITGGTGFIGRVLRNGMGAAYDIHSFQRVPAASPAEHQIDLEDKDGLRTALERIRPDVLVHTAALSDLRGAENDPAAAVDVNIRAAARIAEEAVGRGVSAVIALSSIKAASPQSTYGLSKALMERCLFQTSVREPHARVFSLRLPNVLDSPRSVLGDWRRMLRDQGRVITTGFEMERFACTSDDVLQYVKTLINSHGCVASGTLTPVARAFRIKDALAAFTERHSCSYERRDSALDTLRTEALIAEHELKWTSRLEAAGQSFFHTSPGVEKAPHLERVVDTSSAAFYGSDDYARLVSPQPPTLPEPLETPR